MPNQPKTPARNIRIADETWLPAKGRAESEGTTVSQVIRDVLSAYVKGASVLVLAVVAMVTLSACGGTSVPVAPAPPVSSAAPTTLDQARAQVAAENEARARGLIGECTLTGQGSDYDQQYTAFGAKLDGTVETMAAGYTVLVAWIEAQPAGCTPEDVTNLANAIASIQDWIATH